MGIKKNKKYGKYLPTYFSKSIFTIDYQLLKKQNRTSLFFDYDNTIAECQTKMVNVATKELFSQLQEQGFSIYLITNAPKKRVKDVAAILKIGLVANARKPFAKRSKKFIKVNDIAKETIVFIGDQLMTDILLANKLGIISIKVEPIVTDKELLRTKFNRLREEKRLKYFKKHNMKNIMEVSQ